MSSKKLDVTTCNNSGNIQFFLGHLVEIQKLIWIIPILQPVVVDDGGLAVDDDKGGDDPANDGQEPDVALVRIFLTEIVNCTAN